MKKLCLGLLLLLPFCGFAQKGMMGVGAGVEYGIGDNVYDYSDFGSSLTSYGATFKYEYNWTDRIRLSASLNVMNIGDYIVYDLIVKANPNTPDKPNGLKDKTIYEVTHRFTNQSLTAAIFGVDIHFFLNGVRPFRPYLLYGISWAYSSMATGRYEDCEGDFGGIDGFKLGLGFNWRLTRNSSLQLELPIKAMLLGRQYSSGIGGNGYYYYRGNVLSGRKYYEYISGKYYEYNGYYIGMYSPTQSIRFSGFCPSINYIYTF